MEREDQLKAYLGHKNDVLLQDCLDTWRTALMGLQAGRVFNMKLLAAFVSEWRDAAMGKAPHFIPCLVWDPFQHD